MDKTTIARNRKRAREVLYSDAPLVDKVKAAKKLSNTYEKAGTKPVGRDASIINQHKQYIDNLSLGKVVDISEKTGIIAVEGRNIPRAAIPNGIVDRIDQNGKIVQRRLFDENGKAKLDVDLTDHGRPWSHDVPHAHDWQKDKRSKNWRSPTNGKMK